ncbi:MULTISPECIES: competence type IV pilus minor pilin ComGD [unclassified Staphylococcus]|uniref:competence type IV pilus minor pilin ComGD n=2 Tax=Staphylococcus TaxID=1279 RepID=UPI00194F6E6B|nr:MULTISPECIES: competence type IV pilus minor pilin ComGD [unclassified Staphylococcus]
MQTSKAFTYIEMLMVMAIISILLIVQVNHIPINDKKNNANNNFMNDLITQLNYLKSKAIKDDKSITLIFNDYSNKIIVREQSIENKDILFPPNTFVHPKSNIRYLTFNNKGNINKFGSVLLSVDNEIFKLIFHIEKGRLRYEKIKH